MDMTVRYCLASGRTAVDPNVEAQDRLILPEQKCACLGDKAVTSACFSCPKIEIIGRVTLRNHEHVAISYRMIALSNDSEAVLE
jgi:hypothetical protein